jgi:hypothetical protein
MDIKNLAYIRSLSSKEFPDLGPKLAEALQGLAQQGANLTQQLNGNGTGNPQPPPAVNGLKVTGQNGHFNIAIQDGGKIFRDVHYYVEHADNPHFTNPSVIHLGHSRNHSIFLGNVTRYWRAYSAYASSATSQPAYHGSPTNPMGVAGGGTIGGPEFLPSEGSGTGAAGVGLSGPGPVPFRSTTGAPPIRNSNANPPTQG